MTENNRMNRIRAPVRSAIAPSIGEKTAITPPPR